MDRELRDIVELVSNVTDAFTAALFLFETKGERLRLAAWHTLSKNLDTEADLAPGDGIIGWVAKTNEAINLSRFDQDTRPLRLYRQDEDIKSFLAVPVGQEGVLCVDSKQTYVFTEKDQKLLAGFAVVVRHLLEAKRVRRREKGYARMLRLLYQVEQAVREPGSARDFVARILSEVKAFTGADVAFFTTPNRNWTRYRVEAVDGPVGPNFQGTSYSLDSGLVGWVYKENRRLVLQRDKAPGRKSFIFSPDDPIRTFKSFIGLPLKLWGETIGVLGLAAAETKLWSSDDIHVLTMTGQWVASAYGALAA